MTASILAGSLSLFLSTLLQAAAPPTPDAPRLPRPALPLSFVENEGQWPDASLFIVRQGALTAALEKDAIRLRIRDGGLDDPRYAIVRLAFGGASGSARPEGVDRQSTYFNYF